MSLKLEALYRDHLQLAYTCIDRIYLRGYVPILQTCGGFRCWAERLRPNEPVTQSWIRSLSRRFHTNVSTYAQEHGIPVLQVKPGQRKHELAQRYRAKSESTEGVYLILKSFEKAKTYTSEEPRRPTQSLHRNLGTRNAFVMHYSFYIVDRNWGPICVVICSHPSFRVKVFLNGHHWVERRAHNRGIETELQDNAVMSTDSPQRLQQIADRLPESEIRRVADRWVYRLLPILTYKQRHDTRFRYEWSMAQMELSHNLVFRPSYPVAELFHRHIDLNRRLLSPRSIATVFGKKRAVRPEKTSVSVFQSYDSRTVFRVKHDRSVIKQYDKHQQILRTECVCNDPWRFGVGRRLCNFSALRAAMNAALQRFQSLQQAVANTTIDRGELAALAQTSELGASRVPGIRLENERLMTVLRLLGGLATGPRGFSAGQLRQLYERKTGQAYSPSQVTYDLRKLRAKHFLVSVSGTRRYVFTDRGAQLAVLLYKVRGLLLGPTVASVCDPPGSTSPRIARRGPRPEPLPDNLSGMLARHAGNVSAVAAQLGRQPCVVRRWIARENLDLTQFRQPIAPPGLDDAYRDVDRALLHLVQSMNLKPAA